MDTNHVLALVAVVAFVGFLAWRIVKAKKNRASGSGSGSGGDSKLSDLKKK